MTNYTNTTATCTQCKESIHHGETVNDISGDLYHEKCWREIAMDYAEANIIEPEAGQHCESCGWDLNRKGIETVLDGDQVKCFHCVLEEGLAEGKTTI